MRWNRMWLPIALGLVSWRSSLAQSCSAFAPNEGEVVTLNMVTMNKNGVASFTTSGMAYAPARRLPNLPRVAAAWRTAFQGTANNPAPQLFSDRVTALQPFAIRKGDVVDVAITVEAQPQVTLTLRSHGNVKAVFRVTCSTGGVMHGSTPDVDYLLFLTRRTPVG